MKSKIKKNDEEWQKQLTNEQYQVTRKKATELPFSGEYNFCKEAGVYTCVCCGQELFNSDDKFDSGSGWPSFTRPIAKDSMDHEDDASLFLRRTEVLCSKCNAHLGHVFPDGPKPTCMRYCINSAALKLEKKK